MEILQGWLLIKLNFQRKGLNIHIMKRLEYSYYASNNSLTTSKSKHEKREYLNYKSDLSTTTSKKSNSETSKKDDLSNGNDLKNKTNFTKENKKQQSDIEPSDKINEILEQIKAMKGNNK